MGVIYCLNPIPMRFSNKVASSLHNKYGLVFFWLPKVTNWVDQHSVATVNHRAIRQLFDFFQRLIQRLRTAITQVRTTTAVNEHGIAGNQMVTHIKALPTNGMARRC